MAAAGCAFCRIVSGETEAAVVLRSAHALGFLDHRPLFPGHTLIVPQAHHETLAELPESLVGAFFSEVRLLARAVQSSLGAEGTFVAANNTVSQSVPHFHVHVVPRRRRDGLRGFFWPRQKYASLEQMAEIGARIALEVERLR